MKNNIFNNLQEANERLDAIIENSFDGIYITDNKANTIKVNKSYEIITGLKKEEVLGKNMIDLIKNNVISISGSVLALQKKEPVTLHQEFKTGKKALITSSPVFDKNGDIIMVVTNVRDLTEIYRLKKEAQQNNFNKNNTPINNNDTLQDKNIISIDENSKEVLNIARKVAELDTTVMLIGETGVGKELFANYILKNSKRENKSFIKVNCGAIPPSLAESEFFGYEKGAFTGADKNGKAGIFEAANNGTVFLDEIGELPLSLQVKLLRVLQENEIERVGGTKSIKVNVRIIAATNANLEKLVEQKLFRKDLYYRLMVFPIYIPPLRKRKKDIIPLVNLFKDTFNKKYGFNKSFSNDVLEKLQNYDWPGNIRELRNIVERGLILAENIVTIKDLIFFDKKEILNNNFNLPDTNNLKELIEKIELSYINKAYDKYKNVRQAAESLNMDPSTFVRKRKKYSK